MAVHKEFEGKNVESAIEAASKSLGISADKLEYEVIEYGNSGLFGFIGVKKAKIKVMVSSDDKSEENVSSLVDEAFSSGKLKSKKKSYFSKSDKNKKTESSNKEEVSEKKEEKITQEVVKEEPKSFDTETEIDSYEEDDEGSFTGEVSEEAVEKGRETLEKILPLLTESFEISPEIRENEVLYNLKAENPGVVIGKKGQNLEAMQFLVDKIVNKLSEGRVRVLIDIEDYLERRKQNLHSIALRYADKVKKSGKPATIGQLSAYERRFIHIALRDDRRVRTQSMGEGYYRKLVVFPSRRTKGKRRVPKNR